MTALTHYDTLGLKSGASAEEIKRAYRRLAAKTHPDVGGDSMAGLFLDVQAAFETLGSQTKRDAYDHMLQERDRPGPDPVREAMPERPSGETAHWRPAAVTESIIKVRVPALFWLLLTLWAAILPVILESEAAAGLLAEPGAALPAGAGTLIYAGLWLAGFLQCLRGKAGKGFLPVLALAAGAGSALWLHGGTEISVAVHAAAGLGFSGAAASFARRRRNLALMGITSKGVPRTLTFDSDLGADDAAAQRRTYRSFGALLAQPGTRVLEGACVNGRVLQHLIVNGRRAAVFDSKGASAWLVTTDGDLEGGLDAARDAMRTALMNDMDTLGWLPASDRAGWIAVHPAASGSVRLSDADGSRVSICAPSTGAEELYEWLAGGSSYGVVDPCFLYRLVHEGASPLRNYRHA